MQRDNHQAPDPTPGQNPATKITGNGKDKVSKRKINQEKTKQLMSLGLPQSDIAKHQGVNPSAVNRYIKSLNQQEILEYKAKRSEYLTLDQIEGKAATSRVLRYFNTLPDSKFKAMPDDKKIGFGNLGNVVSGTAYDKERVESGQAIEITGVQIRVLLDSLPPPRPVQALPESPEIIDAELSTDS